MSKLFHSSWIFIVLRPSHAAVISPLVIFYLRQISSAIGIILNIPDILLLYASWSLACPGEVLEDATWCFLYSDPSMIRAYVPHYPLMNTSLVEMDVPSRISEAMYISEVVLGT